MFVLGEARVRMVAIDLLFLLLLVFIIVILFVGYENCVADTRWRARA
jgi:hypothetical protein